MSLKTVGYFLIISALLCVAFGLQESNLRNVIDSIPINNNMENKYKEPLREFFVETEKCYSDNIASTCSNPLVPGLSNYTCLDEWEKCVRSSIFYKKYSLGYKLQYALQMSKNMSLVNPLAFGTNPKSLLEYTNKLYLFVNSIKLLLKQNLARFSETTDFYNQMAIEYDTCIQKVVGTRNISLCGQSAHLCFSLNMHDCLFNNQSFYRSYDKSLNLQNLMKEQLYADVHIAIPLCETDISCNSNDVQEYLSTKWAEFTVNMGGYLLYLTTKDITNTVSSTFWVGFGVTSGILACGCIFIILLSFVKKQ